MRPLAQFLAIIFLFTADVRVRAADRQIVDPPGCQIGGDRECLLRAHSQRLVIDLGSGRAFLAHGTLVRWHPQQGLRLIRGVVHLRGDKLRVDTAFGLIELQDDSEAKVEMDGRVVKAIVFKGQAELRPSGERPPVALQAGWSNRLEPASESPVGSEIPQALSVKDLIQHFTTLAPERGEKLKSYLRAQVSQWQASAQIASSLYGDLARREIAAADVRRQAQARAEAARRAEAQEMRRKFRDSLYLDGADTTLIQIEETQP